MGRYIIPAAIVLVGLTLYALFEALMTPAHEVRSLPKWGWVAVVVLLPLVGPLLWLVLGRARVARGAGLTPADVNKVMKQYQQMEKMMGKLGRGGMKGMMRGMRGMMGAMGGGGRGGMPFR